MTAVAESKSITLRPVRVTPNPVTDRADVSFQVHRSGSVNCMVYDAAGNRVAVLADGLLPAGEHRLTWDATSVEPGIYFCQIVSGDDKRTARLTRVR